jgi:hypothetical protein
MKSRWVRHKGVEILYGDFSHFERDVAGLRAEVAAADAEIFRRPRGSVLAIADLTNTVTSSEVVDLFKASAAATKDYMDKQAVVGITGFQKVLARGVAFFSGQSMRVFDSVAEAMDWLVGDAPDGGEEIPSDFRK